MNQTAQRILAAVCEEHMTWHALEKKMTSAGMGLHGFSSALGWLMRHKMVHQVGHVEDDGSRWTSYAPSLTAWTVVQGRPVPAQYFPRLNGYAWADGLHEDGARPVAWDLVFASEAEAVRASGGGK